MTRRVQARVLRELKRRGMLRDPNDARNEAEDEPMIGCAQLSLRLGKLGRVDEHGRVQPDDMDLDARFARRGKPWCADIDAYSLHAGVTVRGDEAEGRSPCRRPPLGDAHELLPGATMPVLPPAPLPPGERSLDQSEEHRRSGA